MKTLIVFCATYAFIGLAIYSQQPQETLGDFIEKQLSQYEGDDWLAQLERNSL